MTGVIDLAIGQPSLSLLPTDALRTAADHCLSRRNPDLLQYGADQGEVEFRQSLAHFLSRRYATTIDVDHLMVSASASQALDLVCTRFTQPGDTIFVEEPTYFLALHVFSDHGLRVIGIPLDEDGIRMDALQDALTRNRPAFLYTIRQRTAPLHRRNFDRGRSSSRRGPPTRKGAGVDSRQPSSGTAPGGNGSWLLTCTHIAPHGMWRDLRLPGP